MNLVASKDLEKNDNFIKKDDTKKKSILQSILSRKEKKATRSRSRSSQDMFDDKEVVYDLEKRFATDRDDFIEGSPNLKKAFLETRSSSKLRGVDLWNFDNKRGETTRRVKEFRYSSIFVATWNVGGRAPKDDLDLEEFLQVDGFHDLYVIGFQEIVPLNTSNVLVVEDNKPAMRWLSLISQTINKASDEDEDEDDDDDDDEKSLQGRRKRLFFQRSSLKGGHVEACNCTPSSRTKMKDCKSSEIAEEVVELSSKKEDERRRTKRLRTKYCLVASKQMVGIFLLVWARRELEQYIGHLRIDTIGRGIMRRLGNKGCIAMSMVVHQTNFCFICCHLASGKKDGDELKRNVDVAKILKTVHFPKVKYCKNTRRRSLPERILDHDRVIWLGDLNYRVALSYHETRTLISMGNWKALSEWDQLKIERESRSVFGGWKEGKISFAPTYKYSHNSDTYAGETLKSKKKKKKRRTPAWCDRILWHGSGMEQLQYLRRELRFSDHRPVCAVFAVEAETNCGEYCKGDDSVPQRQILRINRLN